MATGEVPERSSAPKGRPAHESDSHGPEVVGGDRTDREVRTTALRSSRPSLGLEAHHDRGKGLQGQGVARGGVFHPRNRTGALDEPLEEGGFLLGPRVTRLVEVEGHREHPRGLEAGVEGGEALKAAHEEAGAREEHESQGDLGPDQDLAQPPSSDSRGRAWPRLPQSRGGVGTRGQKGGNEAGQEAREHGEGKGETHDPALDADAAGVSKGARELGGHESEEDVGGPTREEEAKGPPREGDQAALREQETHEPASAGAQRRADGHLLLACDRAGEEQVADVGTRYREDEPDGDREQRERRTHVGHQSLLERHDLEDHGGGCWRRRRVHGRRVIEGGGGEVGGGARDDHGVAGCSVCRRVRCRLDALELSAGLVGRHARPEPPDHGDDDLAPAQPVADLVESQRQQDLHFGPAGEGEGCRQDAYHRVKRAVELEGLLAAGSDAGKQPSPQAVREYDHLRARGPVLLGKQAAAPGGGDAEGGQEARRDPGGAQALRLSAADEGDACRRPRRPRSPKATGSGRASPRSPHCPPSRRGIAGGHSSPGRDGRGRGRGAAGAGRRSRR